MLKSMKSAMIYAIIISIFFSSLSFNVLSDESYVSTDIDKLSYRQEIEIPIDTSLAESIYQPIDISIDFENSCWAIDELQSSVRVGVEIGSGATEIPSQIYDLEFIDDTHISSCNLVFIIPETADGNEKYYVYYDSSETAPAEYEDNLEIEDSHYFYEPISGQIIDFDYFGIKQDGYVVYAVIQKGELLGSPIAFAVAKFKPGSEFVETFNLDQLGDFDFRYGINEEPAYFGTSWCTDINKQVLVDGPLMIRVRLESTSPQDNIRTDNIYTYYYNPTQVKKMNVDCFHEILEDIDIEEPSTLDGTFAGITSIKSRSASIDKMNIGEIMPEVVLYSEDDSINTFSVPSNPDSLERELILATEDDIDLGINAWACLADSSTGKAHGLILNSNEGLSMEENSGAQVKTYVKQNIKLPGLEADTGNLYLTRDAYENGVHLTSLEQGMIYSYKVQFLTIEDMGFEMIDTQSKIYQSLIEQVPMMRENVTEDGEEVEKYSLETFVHFAPSVPFGSLLSAALGKNIPYIYAEIYKDRSFKSAGSASKLPIASIDLDFEGKNLIEKIKTVFGVFNWKELSIFKKITFPDLEAGEYVIRIYRENPIFSKDRQYIGYGIINISKNDRMHIYCRSEGSLKVSLNDQNNNPISNADVLLQINNAVINEIETDENGTAIIKAPCFPLKPYMLKIIYKGFIVSEKQVRFNLRNRYIQLKESFNVPLYNINIDISDKWGFPLVVDVKPKLVSDAMFEPITIKSEQIGDGKYVFSNVPGADYVLMMNFKSFKIEESIVVDQDENLLFDFPAEYKIDLDIYNSYGVNIEQGKVVLSRGDKKESTKISSEGKAEFLVPPADYEITILSEGDEIGIQPIELRSDKELVIVTNQGSFINDILFYIGIIIIILSLIVFAFERKLGVLLKLLVIGLVVISISVPWWGITGEEGSFSTSTNTYVYPGNIVTVTKTTDVIGGDISIVPDEITLVLNLVFMLLIAIILVSLLTIFIKNRFKRTYLLLTILSLVLLIACVGVFYYALSELTAVGVGSFSGEGTLDITIPGIGTEGALACSWGAGLGFYLSIVSVVVLLVSILLPKIKKNKSNN